MEDCAGLSLRAGVVFVDCDCDCDCDRGRDRMWSVV